MRLICWWMWGTLPRRAKLFFFFGRSGDRGLAHTGPDPVTSVQDVPVEKLDHEVGYTLVGLLLFLIACFGLLVRANSDRGTCLFGQTLTSPQFLAMSSVTSR